MDLNKLEQTVYSIISSLNKEEFIYDLLLAYNLPKASITRLKKVTTIFQKMQVRYFGRKRFSLKLSRNKTCI